MPYLSIEHLDCRGKQVVLRADLNVPLRDGKITDDSRIVASLPTIRYVLEHGGSVVVLSHLGQPKFEAFEKALSLAPVAVKLGEYLGKKVPLWPNIACPPSLPPGEVVLCENTRFNHGEKQNDKTLAKQYAGLGKIVIMDAYATIHRSHASILGIATLAKEVCAGLLMTKELEGIQSITQTPKRPLIAIVGGSKISTKLTLLQSLINRVNTLIVGGGIANTFLAAQGVDIGNSLYEPSLIREAQALLAHARTNGVTIPLPIDVITSTSMRATDQIQTRDINDIPEDQAIFDFGPKTRKNISELIAKAASIVWNGPVGVFEIPEFSQGTQAIIEAIGHNQGFSLAGGGDTLAAIAQFKAENKLSQISTGGGAMLSLLQSDDQPGLKYIPQI